MSQQYFVVVAERDHPDWMQSSGAIVMETQLRTAGREAQEEKLASMGDRYGKAVLARLAFPETDEFDDAVSKGLAAKYGAAIEIIERLCEHIDEPPEQNCSCHLSPPCSDCMNYADLRMLMAEAKSMVMSRVKN